MEQRPLGRAADDAAEVGAHRVHDEIEAAAERSENQDLLGIGSRVSGKLGDRVLAARDGRDSGVWARRLGRVVERLPVVGVRSRLEE
jgi:hypothetical protein